MSSAYRYSGSLATYQKILVRATNWLGDAVMSLPALRALRQRFPDAEIAILAKPWVADLYGREPFCDRMIPYTPRTLPEKWAAGRALASEHFDCAILLQNAFEAAARGLRRRHPGAHRLRARWPQRAADPRHPGAAPGEIPRHERFYYLELLRRAGMLERFPRTIASALDGAPAARARRHRRFRALGLGDTVIGMSPGAAYGTAKQWLPERFAAAADALGPAGGRSGRHLRFRRRARALRSDRGGHRSPRAQLRGGNHAGRISSIWPRPAASI